MYAGLQRAAALKTAAARFSSKPPSDSDTIQVIHSNEESYFAEVRKSFDGLKKKRAGESLEEKRSRLMYQSRKRGTAENGLLVGNFSAKFLPGMSERELDEFDQIINELHNEWDLYYWMTNASPVPAELQANSVMKSMRKFCLNEKAEDRTLQSDLKLVKRWETPK
jgi:succinate dehydrogenase assembly factor 2